MLKYDVVIIGSGLGGLLCGNILSKEGKNVCILEKQRQFGGNLQSFKRKGKIFDTGIHYVGGLSKDQNTHQYFKYFDIVDKLNLKKLDVNGFDRINFEGKTYSYAQGFDNFIETLANDFPNERNALKEYIRKIKDICNHFPLYNIRPNLGLDNELQFFQSNVGDLIKSVTKNRTLQNVLAGNNMLYAGIQDKTPVGIHALITNSLIESAYQFVDGSQQIADLLIETITNNGGTLLNNSEVRKLEINNGKIESAILSNGDVIEADEFISTIHPANTIAMTDTKMLRKSYRTRIKEIEETISVFVLYISLKSNSFKYQNYNSYQFNDDNVWSISNYNAKEWPKDYLFITSPTSKSDTYADTAIAMSYMHYDEVKQWENSKIGKRGNEYEEFKELKAKKLLDQIEKQYPNIRSKILNYYTSTPLTIKDYTGTKNGSMYGIMHDSNNPLQTKISPKTKIPNLLLSGQNVNIHGLLGVTIGSVFTCTEMIGMEYLMKKIKNA